MSIPFEVFVWQQLDNHYVVINAIDHGVAQGFLRSIHARDYQGGVICLENPTHGVMYFNPANVISIRPIEEPKREN
jgi:hypothetical protein